MVECPGRKFVFIKSWEQVCVDSGKHESLHKFRSEIGRYEVPREESFR